jgi:hypothetical protein
MALTDVSVARYRVAVSLNNVNPVGTSHSAGSFLSYPNPPRANADVDDEGEIDLSVSIYVYIDVDTTLDADDGGGHAVDDADPLNPFHHGTFYGNDAAVEDLCLYGYARKDPKPRIISQGGGCCFPC